MPAIAAAANAALGWHRSACARVVASTLYRSRTVRSAGDAGPYALDVPGGRLLARPA